MTNEHPEHPIGTNNDAAAPCNVAPAYQESKEALGTAVCGVDVHEIVKLLKPGYARIVPTGRPGEAFVLSPDGAVHRRTVGTCAEVRVDSLVDLALNMHRAVRAASAGTNRLNVAGAVSHSHAHIGVDVVDCNYIDGRPDVRQPDKIVMPLTRTWLSLWLEQLSAESNSGPGTVLDSRTLRMLWISRLGGPAGPVFSEGDMAVLGRMSFVTTEGGSYASARGRESMGASIEKSAGVPDSLIPTAFPVRLHHFHELPHLEVSVSLLVEPDCVAKGRRLMVNPDDLQATKRATAAGIRDELVTVLEPLEWEDGTFPTIGCGAVLNAATEGGPGWADSAS